MPKDQFRIRASREDEADELALIRVEAMRPSLEAVGRFDPERARNRFLASFRAADTKIVYVDKEVAGFFVVRNHPDHFYLDHLYVSAAYQGRGIGRRIVGDLQVKAAQLPYRLGLWH